MLCPLLFLYQLQTLVYFDQISVHPIDQGWIWRHGATTIQPSPDSPIFVYIQYNFKAKKQKIYNLKSCCHFSGDHGKVQGSPLE